MSCSKLSTTVKFPISVRMKIPKERLLAENQKEEWQIKSEDCSIQGLPGFSYFVGLCSETFEDHERFNGRCLFILMGLKKKNAIKMNIRFKVTFVGSNHACEYDNGVEFHDAYDHLYIPCGRTDALFDPTKKWFVNDILVFVVEAILTVQKDNSELAGLNSEISETFEYKFGMKLWDQDDKNLAFIVDGKEIKVHRIVVESKFPEWKEMIQSGLKESEDGKIAIDDFDFETVETALKFCYGIEENWSVDSTVEVLKFANDYDLNDLKNSVETFLSSQISPINACKITNSSILSNSVKLRETCFEYLLECNQKKIFVADLDSLNKDIAFELMKSSFSQSPNLNEFEMIPQIVEQVQNQPPQIRRSFVIKVIVIVAFMLFTSYLIGAFLTNDDNFLQGINQIWRKHIFCEIQLLWFGIYFTIDHFQVLRQQKYLKWISLLIFVSLSGFLVSSCINCYGHDFALFALVNTLFFTIQYTVRALFDIVTALFESYDFTDDYIWPYCLIPNVLILLIKEFLPFSWLFSIISGIICLDFTKSTLVKHFQQIMGNKSVVINENEFVHASLTLFTIILQAFIFNLGFVNGIVECKIEYGF